MSVQKVRETHHSAHLTTLIMDLTALSIRLNLKLISNKKIFSCFLITCVKHVTPGAHFWPQGHNLNKLGKGALDNAIYQISML